jgi:hypothetical protein
LDQTARAADVSGQVQLKIAAPGTAFPRRKALGVFASGHLNIWKHQTANASNAIGHVQPLNSRKFSEPVRDAPCEFAGQPMKARPLLIRHVARRGLLKRFQLAIECLSVHRATFVDTTGRC